MFELFYWGGPVMMSLLTFLLLTVLVVSFVNGVPLFKEPQPLIEHATRKIAYIKSVGLFALVTGIFGQLLGLYGAFGAFAEAGSVSPTILSSGLRISMITTVYGFIIYILSYLIWMGLSLKLKK